MVPGLQVSRAMSAFQTHRRIALTGHPLMNNLAEYFTMIEWACPGYFPDKRAFDKEYTEPITTGRMVTATKRQRNKMMKAACVLSSMLESVLHRVGPARLLTTLPRKCDMLVQLQLPPALSSLYQILVHEVRPASDPGAAAGTCCAMLEARCRARSEARLCACR